MIMYLLNYFLGCDISVLFVAGHENLETELEYLISIRGNLRNRSDSVFVFRKPVTWYLHAS